MVRNFSLQSLGTLTRIGPAVTILRENRRLVLFLKSMVPWYLGDRQSSRVFPYPP